MLLTPICVELLVERYVRWHVQKGKISYFAALPRRFVDALREYSSSDIPVVRAIIGSEPYFRPRGVLPLGALLALASRSEVALANRTLGGRSGQDLGWQALARPAPAT